jgi:hypothetical protein
MKITFVGHASLLIEAGGLRILSDPWWRGPCFGAQWWTYPLPFREAVDGYRVDYIYISHGHHDHFHPATLRTLNRDAKIIVSDRTNLAPHLEELGFTVLKVKDDQLFDLGGGVTCRIMATYGNDTLMVVTDEREVCLNLNDALHSAPHGIQSTFIARLKELYPTITYVFCGFGAASHFPNCYVISGKDREATAAHRQRYFNREWVGLIGALQPIFGFPFAADVVFFEDDLFWLNELNHNAERPTDAFRTCYPHSPVCVIDIAPGFIIENGKVFSNVLRAPISADTLCATCTDQIKRANRYGVVEESVVAEVLALLRNNLDLSARYLQTYEGDYRFLIRLRNSPLGIHLEKAGRTMALDLVRGEAVERAVYDVIYTTRLPYLRQSLTSPFGNEILFVGSGGIFEYTDRTKIRTNLHCELVQILSARTKAPAPRYGKSSRLMYKLKAVIKRMLGMTEMGLYDLETWTIFKQDPVRDSPVRN